MRREVLLHPVVRDERVRAGARDREEDDRPDACAARLVDEAVQRRLDVGDRRRPHEEQGVASADGGREGGRVTEVEPDALHLASFRRRGRGRPGAVPGPHADAARREASNDFSPDVPRRAGDQHARWLHTPHGEAKRVLARGGRRAGPERAQAVRGGERVAGVEPARSGRGAWGRARARRAHGLGAGSIDAKIPRILSG